MSKFTNKIEFDERGREILSPTPVAFHAPQQERFSVLDYHRQRILEQRQMMRQLLEEIHDDEYETLAEAEDFAVDDPFDPDAVQSVFELDDDDMASLERLAQREYSRLVEEKTRVEKMSAQTKAQDSGKES